MCQGVQTESSLETLSLAKKYAKVNGVNVNHGWGICHTSYFQHTKEDTLFSFVAI